MQLARALAVLHRTVGLPSPARGGSKSDPFWREDTPALLARLETAPAGLTAVEAGRRLLRFGRNTIIGTRRPASRSSRPLWYLWSS